MTDERLKSSRKDDERLGKSPQKRIKALINLICVKSLNNFNINVFQILLLYNWNFWLKPSN